MSASPGIEAAFRGRIGGFELDAAFHAPPRGVTALFGPSGCGKTTVLRCLAGLQRVEHGTCIVTGDVWQDAHVFRPPHRRPVGYVFQEASLFAHLSVRGNLLYGAPRDGAANISAAVDMDEVVTLLGLAPLLDRAPAKLSGGERQRVAIGRALLAQPRILLMDEPLSALDRQTRDDILPFLERLHATLALPIVYVTHDFAEVERLADHLVLMKQGRVIASGALADLQSDLSLPLVSAKEAAVRLDAQVTHYDPAYGLLRLDVHGGHLLVHGAPAEAGDRRLLRIGATEVSLALERPQTSSILNILPCRILSAQAHTHDMNVVLGLGDDGAGARLVARVTRRSWDDLGLHEGRAVFAQIKGVGVLSFG